MREPIDTGLCGWRETIWEDGEWGERRRKRGVKEKMDSRGREREMFKTRQRLEKKWRFKATEWRRKLSTDRNQSGEKENVKIQKGYDRTYESKRGQEEEGWRGSNCTSSILLLATYINWASLLCPPASLLPNSQPLQSSCGTNWRFTVEHYWADVVILGLRRGQDVEPESGIERTVIEGDVGFVSCGGARWLRVES